jgi:SecD/SecF fusion protein
VITEDPVTGELARANPVPRTAKPGLDDRLQADRVIDRVLTAQPRARMRPPVLAPLASALAVVAVVAVAFTIGSSGSGGRPGKHSTEIVLEALPTPQTPVTGAAMSREVAIIRDRLATISPGFTVKASGSDRVVITAPKGGPARQSRVVGLVTQPARLHLYDWEASALTSDGKTVASQLGAHNPEALTISQGSAAAGPGEPGAGGLPLYQAVQLAAKQPRPTSPENTRLGPLYYVFGTPGSAACAEQARVYGTLPIAGEHCLLAGPLSEPSTSGRRRATRDVLAQMAPVVSRSERKVVVVEQGRVVVLQALNPSATQQTSFGSPAARFYVLGAQAELDGAAIRNPQQSTDQAGAPDLTFSFTAAGARRFQQATAAVARRGQQVSTPGQTLNQHFAIALDNRLLMVASIDFKTYPDGISGDNGADIAGGFTKQSARDLATELRYGGLPLNLRLVG